MSEQNNKDFDIDLGSDTTDDFDPFASDDELDDDTVANEQQAQKEAPTPKQSKAATKSSANPIETAINAAESKEAEKAHHNILQRLPVFAYAGASEDIDDTAKTFDELRIEKSTDFPELEDGKRVSWTVEYGKIIKPVSDPKGVTIGKVKSDIEASKEFIDSLKKAKDKSPACKIKPRVTAQSKGTASSYKGVFTNIGEADAAGKVISIVPAKDGKVYEIRNTKMGRFITPTTDCDILSDIRAGFISALPLIPMDMMMRIVAFFRYYMHNDVEQEVLINVYWDKHGKGFVLDVPEQTVTKVSVKSHENLDYAHDRYIHYMDIHSHSSMKAFFSSVDDNDEKATRLYTVIGQLEKYFPDIKTRISNGGKFLEIDPAEVFELVAMPFPDEWKDNVYFRPLHSDDKNTDVPWDTDGDDES